MVLTKEYRVVLPIGTDEYQVAHLWTAAEQSKQETGGGEGVEFIKNEPWTDPDTGRKGQYTYKKISKDSRVPAFIRMIAPAGTLDVYEESWNTYPDYKTRITNGYLKDSFHITILSKNRPFTGEYENPFDIKESDDIERIDVDIANDPTDDDSENDPSTFVSTKTGRGKLGPNWIQDTLKDSETPMICCYKLVEVEFKVFLLQSKVEDIMHTKSRQIATYFYRQLFCGIDHWHGLTMKDIRELEERTKVELQDLKFEGKLRGMSLEDRNNKDKKITSL